MKYLKLCAVAAAITSVPASAATFDAFSSFNGTQLAGNFIYGEVNPAQPNTPGTFFTANTNCFISGSICLQRAPNFDVPGVTKSTVPSFQYNSVNVPTDRLLAHPGNDSNQTFLAFVAPIAGVYNLIASFNIQDIRPSGVGINLIETTNGATPFIFTPLATITGASPSYSFAGSFTLIQGQAVGFGLDNAGFYGNDSTGVNLSVSSVPEAGSWAMMIAGFGLVGGMARRRSTRVVHA